MFVARLAFIMIDDFQLLLNASTAEKNSKESTSVIGRKKTWCVLKIASMLKTQRMFGHFPHAMETVLPCWSGLIERGAVVERKTKDNSYEFESNCGFFITLPENKNKQTKSSYVMEIIEAMGCEVTFGNSTYNATDHIQDSDDYFSPNLYLLRPRFEEIRYVNEPHHAHMLRRRFVSDEIIKTKKGDGKPLQIGLLQRSHNRVIENLKEVQTRLQQVLPASNITYSDFTYNKVKDQAEWFATKDVIVGSHGAAMINSMFITPKTIVMQLYPPGECILWIASALR